MLLFKYLSRTVYASGVVENIKVHDVHATGNVLTQYTRWCATVDSNCFAH